MLPLCSSCGLTLDIYRAGTTCCTAWFCMACLSVHDVEAAATLAHVPDAVVTYGLADCE